MSEDFISEIEAVQDYYREGRPLVERLAWMGQRMEAAREEFRQAEQDVIAWETKYHCRNDSPIHRLLEALQRSVDYVPPSLDRWLSR